MIIKLFLATFKDKIQCIYSFVYFFNKSLLSPNYVSGSVQALETNK